MRAASPQDHSQEQQLSPNLDENQQPVLFDWHSRWLKGHQYQFMLRNAQAYSFKFGIEKYPSKTHPQSIYEQPISFCVDNQDGTVYFVEGRGLGSEFGFPRIEGKKKFRWKKMNFSTNLPKKSPKVTYIVASTTNLSQINDSQQRLYRMHAVVPYSQTSKAKCNYILCHILQIKKQSETEKVETCYTESGKPNFYKMFAFLHNFNVERK